MTNGNVLPNGATTHNTFTINFGGVTVRDQSDAKLLAEQTADALKRKVELFKM